MVVSRSHTRDALFKHYLGVLFARIDLFCIECLAERELHEYESEWMLSERAFVSISSVYVYTMRHFGIHNFGVARSHRTQRESERSILERQHCVNCVVWQLLRCIHTIKHVHVFRANGLDARHRERCAHRFGFFYSHSAPILNVSVLRK